MLVMAQEGASGLAAVIDMDAAFSME